MPWWGWALLYLSHGVVWTLCALGTYIGAGRRPHWDWFPVCVGVIAWPLMVLGNAIQLANRTLVFKRWGNGINKASPGRER